MKRTIPKAASLFQRPASPERVARRPLECSSGAPANFFGGPSHSPLAHAAAEEPSRMRRCAPLRHPPAHRSGLAGRGRRRV